MAEETKIQGIESGRAKFAWECVNEAVQHWKDENDKKKLNEYRSYVKKNSRIYKNKWIGSNFCIYV